jgi:DNA repair exonuclease SbcCD nuclease subunit
LGDCHFGLRNDSTVFDNFARKFYTEVFFPYLKEHRIKTVIQLGDLFDRRKYININTLATAKEYFFEPMREYEFHTLIGNHDIFYRNTLNVNSTSLVLGEYPNIIIHTKPIRWNFYGLRADIIPWICEENEKEIMEFIKDSKSQFCFGHFELLGFEMDRGNFCHKGMDKNTLAHYEQVFSGHFHHKSSAGNILYVGIPFQHTWVDWNDPKGFFVLDTITRELEFIQNPHEIYVKIPYKDDELYFDDVTKHDFSAYTDKYVKVVVIKRDNTFLFDTFMDHLSKANPVDITVVEDFSGTTTLSTLMEVAVDNTTIETINQADDTIGIIDKLVDGLEIELQKARLKNTLRGIYQEALASD